MALLVWTDPRPDIRTSFQAWEATWEHDFKRNYEPPSRLPECGSASRLYRDNVALFNTGPWFLCVARLAKNLFMEQTRLPTMASDIWDSFEVEWRAASEERRKASIEEGIRRVMVSAPLSLREDQRQWCPESSVEHLVSDYGQGYLDLAMSLTLPMSVVISGDIAPVLPPHPAIDRIEKLSTHERNTPGYKTIIRTHILTRAMFLTRIVRSVFVSFSKKMLPFQSKNYVEIANRPSFSFAACKSWRQLAASLSSNEERLVHDEFMEAFPGAANRSSYPCNSCGFSRTDTKQEGSKKLRACSECRRINRLVFYCSQECQRRDWKQGKPYPHKAICGKPLTEQDVPDIPTTKSFFSADGLIPDAEPQFQRIRSTTLYNQIALLLKHVCVDYFIYVPNDTGVYKGRSVVFDLGRKPQFILHRNRALKRGNHSAIQAMYALLVGRGSEVEAGMSHINYDRPIPPSLIHSQLELEFGVTIDTTPLSVSDLHRLCTDATSEELAYIDRALDKSIDRPAKERLELKEFLKSNSPTPYLISC